MARQPGPPDSPSKNTRSKSSTSTQKRHIDSDDDTPVILDAPRKKKQRNANPASLLDEDIWDKSDEEVLGKPGYRISR